MWHPFETYLVNIIVVDGVIKLVVEVIQELDCLGGSAAKKRPKSLIVKTNNICIPVYNSVVKYSSPLGSELGKANYVPKEEGGVLIHPSDD